MKQKIEKCLEKIRPALERDGGNIELVDVDEKKGIVRVRLMGACADCPLGHITLKAVVEATLQDEIPEIKEVIAV